MRLAVRPRPPVGQDRLKFWHIGFQTILTRSGAGAPELQRWARCLSVFMKHPHCSHRVGGIAVRRAEGGAYLPKSDKGVKR